MDKNIDFYKQIEYRELLISRALKGERLSLEEKQWLVTNSVFNHKLGPPYTNYEIVKLPSSSNYNLVIKVEKITYENRIIPIISVPSSKGRILCGFPVTNLNGKTSVGKPIKMIGIENIIVNQEICLEYQSKLGLLAIEYQCDYFDGKQDCNIRKSSSSGDFNFAMFKESLTHNKIRMHCKAPQTDNLEALVFTIEWTK